MILHFISLLTSIIFFIVFFSFILFDGFQGVQTMLHHHSNLIIFSGHYGGGERNIIDLSKFISSLKGLYVNNFYFFITYLTLITLIFSKICLNFKRNKFYSYEGIVIFFALILMLVAILKHYVPYYLVSVVVIFPFAILFVFKEFDFISDINKKFNNFLNNLKKTIALLLIPILAYPSFINAKNEINSRYKEKLYSDEVMFDTQSILSDFPLNKDQIRLWMYRIVSPQFQRNFIIEFISNTNFQERLVNIQGHEYQFSPWNNWVMYQNKWQKIDDFKWKYIVVDVDGLKHLNKEVHSWISSKEIKSKKYNKLEIFYYE